MLTKLLNQRILSP